MIERKIFLFTAPKVIINFNPHTSPLHTVFSAFPLTATNSLQRKHCAKGLFPRALDISQYPTMENMENDLLDSLLDLEDGFYQEGHDLGVKDGAQAGYIEGSVFAVEKGFEKFLEIGRLRGRALIWAGRLPATEDTNQKPTTAPQAPSSDIKGADGEVMGTPDFAKEAGALQVLPGLPSNSRLEKHITALLSLVDLETLSTENTEEAVSDIDDRLKKAKTKVKIIEKIIGEHGDGYGDNASAANGENKQGDGTGNIEDISALHVRR